MKLNDREILKEYYKRECIKLIAAIVSVGIFLFIVAWFVMNFIKFEN